jgi:hypothetical protein
MDSIFELVIAVGGSSQMQQLRVFVDCVDLLCSTWLWGGSGTQLMDSIFKLTVMNEVRRSD